MANKIYNVRDEAYKYSIFGKKEHNPKRRNNQKKEKIKEKK